MKISFHDAGHLTKTAAMSIYGIILKILFPGSSGSISLELGMRHQRLKFIIFLHDLDIIYSNVKLCKFFF